MRRFLADMFARAALRLQPVAAMDRELPASRLATIAFPPAVFPQSIAPEHVDGEWSDELGDYSAGHQAVDLRLFRFDGRPVRIVVPAFGDGETDLYRAFALS